MEYATGLHDRHRHLNTISYDNYDNYSEHQRWLAGDKPEALDYSVLSVGVMTLGLILCVEVLRHKLDQIASHRAFFKVVLEATYSECECCDFVAKIIPSFS